MILNQWEPPLFSTLFGQRVGLEIIRGKTHRKLWDIEVNVHDISTYVPVNHAAMGRFYRVTLISLKSGKSFYVNDPDWNICPQITKELEHA